MIKTKGLETAWDSTSWSNERSFHLIYVCDGDVKIHGAKQHPGVRLLIVNLIVAFSKLNANKIPNNSI